MVELFVLAKNAAGKVRGTNSGGAYTVQTFDNYLSDYGGYARQGDTQPVYWSGVDGYTFAAEDIGNNAFAGWFTLPSNITRAWYRPTAGEASVLISTSRSITAGFITSNARYQRESSTSTSRRYIIYPAFGKIPFTITFDPNGGEAGPKTQTVYSGSSVKLVSTYPGRSGYKFIGWSKSSTATTATYKAGGTYQWTEFSDNPTLYAVWAVAILVIYDPNGGTASRVFDRLAKGETFPALPTATLSGQSTNRWYTAASGGKEIHQGDTVTQTSDFTLYAHWSIPVNTHTLAFNANGGTVSPVSRTLAEGASYGTLPTPTRSGYTFVEWRTAPFLGDRVTSSTQMGTDDVTIYAIWTGNPFTITFNANGGTVSPSTKSVPNGNPFGTLPTPTRSGWVFDGWHTAATGGTKISVTAKPSSSQTVYAHWHQQLPEGGSEQWVY